jgi:SAM-dependent methyltransferase
MNDGLGDFYQERLDAHGNSAKGVGWKDEIAQRVRFAQLVKILRADTSFSINDLGCGTGALAEYLHFLKADYRYTGYDILPEMIQRAVLSCAHLPNSTFRIVSNAAEMSPADYTLASGLFNLPFGKSAHDWHKHILETISIMNEKSVLGFAFNALTKYSDPHLMRPELCYSDPLLLFDYCKNQFSKNVALLHDYDLYDFTILVRKG